MSKLTGRLGLLADMIPPGLAVADIGADHAHLAIYLAEQGISPRVIVTELGDGPMARARQALDRSPGKERIELRQGDGLQVLLSGEAETVVLAGMGGDTIVGILGFDWSKAATFARFLFQPMTRVRVLRESLAEQGWSIDEERLVREEERLYIVMAARPGRWPQRLNGLELEIGPSILRADDELKREYISRKIHKLRTLYNDMIKSQRPEIMAAARVYRDHMSRLEAILDASSNTGHN